MKTVHASGFIRVSFIVLAVFSFLFSCKQAVEPEVDNEMSLGILPLKVGYYWEYKTYALNPDTSIGQEVGQQSITIARKSYHPTREVPDPLYHLAIMGTLYEISWAGYEEMYHNYADGLYRMGGRNPVDSIYTKFLVLKYPVQIGEEWDTPRLTFYLDDKKEWFFLTRPLRYVCLDTNAVFETPLGNFKCVVYNYQDNYAQGSGESYKDVYEYYSPKVGPIGVVTHFYNETQKIKSPVSKTILVSTNVPAD